MLLFRERLKSVMFLKEFGSRWDALLWYWGAVCRQGPCGPISSLRPWFLLIDLHGFYKWVFEFFEVLNVFLRQVVVSRTGEGLRRWRRWLRENLRSRPCACFGLTLFLLLPSLLVVKDPQAQFSRIIVEPHLVDAEFRKAWMPYFCGSGQGLVI